MSSLCIQQNAEESAVRAEVGRHIRVGVDEAVRAIMIRLGKSTENAPDGRARLLQILTEEFPTVLVGDKRCVFAKQGEFLVLKDAPPEQPKPWKRL